jgi:hypothetical protein
MKLTSGCETCQRDGLVCTDEQDATLSDWEDVLGSLLDHLLEDEDFTSMSTSLKEISKSLATIAHYLRVIP